MIKFTATPAESALIRRIAARAKTINGRINPTSLRMDLEAVHSNGCQLDLDALLKADQFNFVHDVFGVILHIDRTTGELKDHFSPRFAVRQTIKT